MKQHLMLRLAAAFGAVAICGIPAASAGPVTGGSGIVVMTFESASDFGEETRQTFDVTFPESRVVEFDGRGDDPLGSRGLGRVDYAMSDTGDGATFRAEVSTETEGAPISDGSSTSFSLSFTTDRALNYDYRADTGGGRPFTVAFDDFSASAEVDVFGNLSGDWPGPRDPNGNTQISFDEIHRTGVLAAGTHTLSVEAVAGLERDTGGGSNGSFNLVLTPADDGGPTPTPVPLPAAVWPGLAALGGVFGVTQARKRRAAQ
jgi:hypothetical protein